MKPRARAYASIRRQTGVGLIEVLIAVLVLSFGMLGLANLQMFSLRHNQSAHERSMAVVQTHSIVDAMRTERAIARNGGFDISIERDAALPTGSAFATAAVAAWRENLTVVLGEDASGSVDCNDTRCTIVVRWNDERAGGSTKQEIETEVQL